MPTHRVYLSANEVDIQFQQFEDEDGDMLHISSLTSDLEAALCGSIEEIQSVLTNAYQMVVKAKHAPKETSMMKPVQFLIQKAFDEGLLRYPPERIDWNADYDVYEFDLRRTPMSGVEFGYNLLNDRILWAVQSIDGVELDHDDFLTELKRAVGVEEKPSILGWENKRTLKEALEDVEMFGFGHDEDSDSIVEEAAKSHLERLSEQPCQHYAATRAIVDEEPEVTAHNDEPERTYLVTQITEVQATDDLQAIERVNVMHRSCEVVSQEAEPKLVHYEVGLVMRYWAEDADHAIEQFHDEFGHNDDALPNVVKEVE